MPKPRTKELIQCQHYCWRLGIRKGVWQADGRTNYPNLGRHSLGTKDKIEARQLLAQLDRQLTEKYGLASKSSMPNTTGTLLSLDKGRILFEEHLARPRVVGGVRNSTLKRYRAIFNKFIPFAKKNRVEYWREVNASLLTKYVTHLENKGYANKTLRHELTTIKQAYKWLIEEGHIGGVEPIILKLRKTESESAYCWKPEEVKAMLEHCSRDKKLTWLKNVILALSCTGLRISELVSLRWKDIDFQSKHLTLTDESGRVKNSNENRRQLKSGRSRSFPIHSKLLDVILSIDNSKGCVFCGPRSGKLKPDTVRHILVRDVLEPLAGRFPTPDGEKGFINGRLHSFRHYFCSTCANNNVPERIVMTWLGHKNSKMIQVYYHLHDQEAQNQMDQLNFLG